MNVVILHGNLAADPETRFTEGGMAIVTMRVATNERVKKGEEWVDEPQFHRCVCFGKRAEVLAQHMAKGSKICVRGKLRHSSYEKDGETRWSTDVVIEDFDFGGGGGGGKAAAKPAKTAKKADKPADDGFHDEELPF